MPNPKGLRAVVGTVRSRQSLSSKAFEAWDQRKSEMLTFHSRSTS